MGAERVASGSDGPLVRVQVALGGGDRAVAGDDAQDVDPDACVGHPGQPGVPQAVSAEVLVAELHDDVVPVSGVAETGGGDGAAARAGEQAGV